MNVLGDSTTGNIIIYGPPGCGKTNRRETFKKLFDKDRYFDEIILSRTTPGTLPHNALILTHEEPNANTAWCGEWISFHDACMMLKWS